MRRLGATASERALFLGLIAFVGAVSVAPLARLLLEGVAPGGRLDLGILRSVLGAPRTWLAAERTLATALASTAIATVLGTAFALLVGATDLRGKSALGFVFLLPLMIPSQVTAIAWINLLGPASPLLKTLGLAPAPGTPHPLYGFSGIAEIMGLEHAPLVFLTLRAALASLPGEAIEAAEAAGARRLRIIRTIVLPMCLPALAAGAALAFISAIGNFGTPALLGIPAGYSVLTVLIYQELAGFAPAAISQVAVLSLLLGALALLGIAAERWASGRHDIRWAQPRTRRLIPLRGAAPVFLVTAWAVLALVVAVPLTALLATALVKAYGLPLAADTITTENFRYVLTEHAATARAALNSLFLASATALVVAVVGVFLGYVVVWRDGVLARALAVAAELPYALPGVVLALAAILVFLRPLPLLHVSLYGTLWIILAAYFARFLVLALRTIVAAYRQIHPSLEEAAAIAGAGLWRRIGTIILPLAAPAVAAGAVLVFLIALNELTVSALLWSAGHETLGVVVFSLEQGGDSTLAAALSVLVVVATAALMALASLAARRLPEGVLPWQG
ncbi:MAG TPA: iron ABC transporter permease [Stellaceae bacterium]|nr:iron ABC transporter permease [Stellaceae bacterium]